MSEIVRAEVISYSLRVFRDRSHHKVSNHANIVSMPTVAGAYTLSIPDCDAGYAAPTVQPPAVTAGPSAPSGGPSGTRRSCRPGPPAPPARRPRWTCGEKPNLHGCGQRAPNSSPATTSIPGLQGSETTKATLMLPLPNALLNSRALRLLGPPSSCMCQTAILKCRSLRLLKLP